MLERSEPEAAAAFCVFSNSAAVWINLSTSGFLLTEV